MRSISNVLITVFILLTAMSCSKKQEVEPVSDQILHISIGASPQSIDPHVAVGVPGIKVISALSEGLVSLDLNTFEIIPAAAESWKISDDGLRYTFKLREGARWSNGDPITAQDFADSWFRAMSPGVGWQFANDYYFLKGAEELHTGQEPETVDFGVTALDSKTLQFDLKRPYPVFLKQLSSDNQVPVNRKSIEQFGDFLDVNTKWTNAGNYVSNGPFVLDTWEVNKILILKKNPYYWGADSVRLDEIHMYPLESESAEERAFRAGQTQVMFGSRVPVDKVAKYQKDSPELIHIINSYATYFYLFNTVKPPFNDIKVRRALSHAINRDSIVANITKSGESAASTLNPPTPHYSEQIKHLEYDLEKAKALLAEAGFPNGEGFPEASLIYNTTDVHRKIALAIQQMWKVNLGIDVTLQNQEWKVFLNTRQNLDFDIARAGSISSIGDPLDFLGSYTSGHGMNDTGWSNKEYDALIKTASTTIDENQRLSILAEAESLLLSELPLIPLYYYSDSYLIRPEVKGLILNPLKRIDFKSIYIETSQ